MPQHEGFGITIRKKFLTWRKSQTETGLKGHRSCLAVCPRSSGETEQTHAGGRGMAEVNLPSRLGVSLPGMMEGVV